MNDINRKGLRMRWFVKTMALLGVLVGSTVRADTLVSGTIATNTTWTVAGSPYVLTGHVVVVGAAAPVLTIEPGVTVKASGAFYLHMGSGGQPGRLVAVGTAENPILFTTNQPTVTAGFWRGLYLTSAASPASQIANATVEGAGATASDAGIVVTAGTPTLDRVTLQTNQYAGLRINGGAPVMTNSSITGTTGGDGLGIDVYGTASPSISDTTITGNAGAAMTMRAGVNVQTLANVTASGNGLNFIMLIYTAFAGPSSASGVAVEGCRTETHFGRSFLVGTVPLSQRDWAAGLRVAVAWDQVAHCLVFDSVAEYERRLSQAPVAWDARHEN